MMLVCVTLTLYEIECLLSEGTLHDVRKRTEYRHKTFGFAIGHNEDVTCGKAQEINPVVHCFSMSSVFIPVSHVDKVVHLSKRHYFGAMPIVYLSCPHKRECLHP